MSTFHLAQLSDLHLSQHPPTRKHLENSLATLMKYRHLIDLLLITGDLCDRSYPDGYGELRDILTILNLPYRLITGNHDHLSNLRQYFPEQFPDHHHFHWTQTTIHFTLIGLDSHIANNSAGYLTPQALSHLQTALQEHEKQPIIIALHHPPIPTAMPLQDKVMLQNTEAFAQIIDTHPNILRILCGHAHQYQWQSFARTIAVIAPSAIHQLHYQPQPEALTRNLTQGGFLIHRIEQNTCSTIHIPN